MADALSRWVGGVLGTQGVDLVEPRRGQLIGVGYPSGARNGPSGNFIYDGVGDSPTPWSSVTT
ncbi:MAG: hypothetical protein ACSLFB_01230 [Acidimicrobiales bacterium]